jgi:hypothetical protein
MGNGFVNDGHAAEMDWGGGGVWQGWRGLARAVKGLKQRAVKGLKQRSVKGL